jgi:hypothetical protein
MIAKHSNLEEATECYRSPSKQRPSALLAGVLVDHPEIEGSSPRSGSLGTDFF